MADQGLIERVARAMCVAADIEPDRVIVKSVGPMWRIYANTARAAIAEVLDAMKEPSEGMVEEAVENVGPIGCCMHSPETATETWQAMLDQFRKEVGL